MANATQNPWILGLGAIAAAVVIYLLYQESQTPQTAAAATAQQNATTATATGTANGIVQSAIPEQLGTMEPGYPATATVTATGTVSGVNTTPATGIPETGLPVLAPV